MALTVEELQIVLSCDATTAQTVLKQMDATVKAYTTKFQSFFDKLGMDKTPKNLANDTKAIEKQLDNVTKAIERKGAEVKKAYSNLYQSFGDEYKPSGRKYVGEATYPWPNKETVLAQSAEVSKMTFGASEANKKLLNLGRDTFAVLGGKLEETKNLTDAVRMKIVDARNAVKQFGTAYVDAVRNFGTDSKKTMAAEDKFKKSIVAADKYIQQLDKIQAKEQAAEQAQAEASGGGQEVESRMARIRQAAAEAGRAIRSAVGGALRVCGQIAQRVAGVIRSGLSLAANVAKKAFSGIGRIFTGLVSRAKKLGANIKKAFDHTLLGKFLKRLGTTMLRMAAMKLIRGTIDGVRKGFEELSKASKSSKKAMTAISNAGLQIRAALGATLMPIVKALVPLFNRLAATIANAANAIARFFAVLTGQGTYTAVSFSESLDDISNSAGGAGKAVKGMLADFDELIVIGNKSGGGGSGSSSEESALGPLEDLIANSRLAELIRSAWENADFTFVGELLAQKLDDALGSIDWAKVYASVANVATSITTFLNGFFADEQLAQDLGVSISNLLTAALGFVLTILDTFDFEKAIQFFETIFTTVINQVNWQDVFGKIVDKLSGFIEYLANKIDETDWSAIPVKIFEKITSVVEGKRFKTFATNVWKLIKAILIAAVETAEGIGTVVSKLATKFSESWDEKLPEEFKPLGAIINAIINGFETGDFSGLGETIGTFITKALVNIPWESIETTSSSVSTGIATLINGFFSNDDLATSAGETIGGIINTACSTAADFVGEVHWDNVGTFLTDGIEKAVETISLDSITGLLSDVLVAALDFSSASLESVDFDELPEKLVEKMTEAFEGANEEEFDAAVSRFFRVVISKIFGALSHGGASNFSGFSWDDISGETISGFFEGIERWLGRIDMTLWLKNHVVIPFIEGFKQAFGIHSPAEEMIEPGDMVGQGILEGIAAPFKAIGTWLNDHIVQPIKDWFSEHALNIDFDFQLPDLSFFKATWDKLKGGKKTFEAKLTGVKESVIGKIEKAWNNITGKDATLTTTISPENSSSLATELSKAWDGIKAGKKNLEAKLSGVKESTMEKIEKAWNAIETKGVELTAEIQEGIPEALGPIKEAWDGIKAEKKKLTAKLEGTAVSTFTTLKGAWEAVKEKTSTLTADLVQKFEMSALTDIRDAFNSVKGKVTSTFEAKLDVTQAVKNFVDGWNGLKDKTLVLKATLTDKVRDAWNKVANAWNATPLLNDLGTLPTFAQGGVVYGPTMGLMGEYAGAKTNPEVIAPLSTLVDLLSKAGAAPGGSASQEQNDLLREQNRLLRQIAQKELTISPSVQLGQVISRSQKLYART